MERLRLWRAVPPLVICGTTGTPALKPAVVLLHSVLGTSLVGIYLFWNDNLVAHTSAAAMYNFSLRPHAAFSKNRKAATYSVSAWGSGEKMLFFDVFRPSAQARAGAQF